ncbi:hypothetical protein BX281_10686 [Streptomyces sp. Ag82_O1-15]|nr:hypothetical protein BX281_10686 [Streptomyces sp. Ag82_O1-15]
MPGAYPEPAASLPKHIPQVLLAAVTNNRDQRGVQDFQAVDGEPGGLAGRLGLDQHAGDAKQVAGLYVGQ